MKTTSHISTKSIAVSVLGTIVLASFLSATSEANDNPNLVTVSTKQPAIYSHKKLDQIFLYADKVNEDNSVLRLYVDGQINKAHAAKVITLVHKGAKGIYINKQRDTYHIQFKVGESQHDLILQVVR